MKELTMCEIETIRLSPLFLAKWENPLYDIPKHWQLMDSKILEMLFKPNETKHLIVSMPPRHGKSEYISATLPAWYLLNFPDNKVILTSYSDDYAQKYGRIAKNLINNYGAYYSVYLAKDSSKSGLFNLHKYKGQMLSSGFYGQLTGQGGNLIIVDDPVKNGSEALSETMRNKTYDTFMNTIYTRLEGNGKIIIVMTRWHEDDLAGRLLKNHSDKFDYLCLPAIADNNDMLGRNDGEALWENHIPLDRLNNIKSIIGSYYWNAMYQQTPSNDMTGFFKCNNINYFRYSENIIYLDDNDISLNNCYTFFTIDLATSEKKTNDFTVISYWAYDGINLYLIDSYYERIDADTHVDKIIELYNKYKPHTICIETVQYQIALFQQMQKLGYPVEKLMPSKQKTIRAMPAATYVMNGQIYFNRNIDKLIDLETEMRYFPYGKNDDFVDTLSYAVQRIIDINFGNLKDNNIQSELVNGTITKELTSHYGLNSTWQTEYFK